MCSSKTANYSVLTSVMRLTFDIWRDLMHDGSSEVLCHFGLIFFFFFFSFFLHNLMPVGLSTCHCTHLVMVDVLTFGVVLGIAGPRFVCGNPAGAQSFCTVSGLPRSDAAALRRLQGPHRDLGQFVAGRHSGNWAARQTAGQQTIHPAPLGCVQRLDIKSLDILPHLNIV